jgi:hypothetical protein
VKPCDTKRQMTNQKNKCKIKSCFANDNRGMIKSIPNIHILKRNPTSKWVDFKTTH